ncbi:MAG TPA: peptidoglycan bridge formation glycyltransferase FemA/FemB family protein [Anaerolineaceae bacterium]
MTPAASVRWDEAIARLPDAHILQTWEWAQVKSRYGWRASPRTWPEGSSTPQAAALVLERTLRAGPLALPLRVMYIPKGPLLDWHDPSLRSTVLDAVQELARQRGAIFVKIDPDVVLGTGLPGEGVDDPLGAEVARELRARSWRFSAEQVQFRNTMCIDLRLAEEELLARMKPKARYNLRLAERKGVCVRPGNAADLGLLYRMYAETSIRDGFVIREEGYYRTVWSTFLTAGMADVLIAEVEGEAVAAVILLRFGDRAWYLYGMSTAAHREKMPNALLQWQAICRAKAAGCTVYDLWGAPDEFSEEDPMWGVYRFKEGLGAQVVRTLGAWDYPVQPRIYRWYTQVLPRILAVMRRRAGQVSHPRGQPT